MALFEDVESFIQNIATGFDCDSDAHKYNTYCRCCEAQKLLEKLKGGPDCRIGNPCYSKGCLSCFCHGNIRYLSYEQAVVIDGKRVGVGCGYQPEVVENPALDKAWSNKIIPGFIADDPPRDSHHMESYVEKFQKAREKWVAWYFSWTEVADVTEAELHTARDGFDAGANWQEKRNGTLENIIEAIRRLSPGDQSQIFSKLGDRHR